MKYNNAKVSFGYRADEFFGAMDGGIDTYKSENRGFFGPFANISIGLGDREGPRGSIPSGSPAGQLSFRS